MPDFNNTLQNKEPTILLFNACVREESRTQRLAEHVLAHLDGEVAPGRPTEH